MTGFTEAGVDDDVIGGVEEDVCVSPVVGFAAAGALKNGLSTVFVV